MADEEERPAVTAAGAGRQKEREARAAAALRANLLRRKAQQRGRDGAAAARSDVGSGDAADDTSGGTGSRRTS
jgi:hypothetical protein